MGLVVRKLVFFSLLLVEVLLIKAMAEKFEVNPLKPSEVKVHTGDHPGWVIPREADEPAESPEEEESAEAPEIRRLGKHHHVPEGSLAGGGVIIGGLITAIFAAVIAYIRVTRKKYDVQH